MTSLRFLLIIVGLTSSILSFGQQPIAANNAPKTASFIAVPLSISFVEMEKMLNATVAGLIYQDDSYTDNDQDEFKIKVWKKSNISIKPNSTNQLKIAVPLKVWAEKGVGALGYVSYQSTEFELILNFKTVFAIRPDWTIKTVTTPDGYTWLTKPVLKYKYVDVPITPIVANILDKQHATFAKQIDDQVTSALDMKPYALQVWNILNTPIQVSEEYESWLQIQPSSIQMTPLKTNKTGISGIINILVNSQTTIGVKPQIPLPATQIPNLSLVNQIPDAFSVETAAAISYDYATQLANKQFQFQKLEFLNGKKSVTIEEITVGKDADKLILNTRLSGNIKGSVIIEGIPFYDSLTQKLALKDVNFQLKSKNLFQKSAAWLFNGKIEKMIEKDYGIPMNEMIEAAKSSLLTTLNSSPHSGVWMNGIVTSLTPTVVKLQDEGMIVMILTTGKASVILSGF
ncbi:MAG TPA: DUF4403 family protein [Saprospiraceae bacterium]|nr:DUF4403 family protein [Saprospiraceae bacterium]